MARVISTLASLCSYSSHKLSGTQHICTLSLVPRKSFSFLGTSRQSASSWPLYLMSEARYGTASIGNEGDESSTNWLVVGDGDLSYSSVVAAELAGSSTTCLFATVLEDEEVHNRIYERSKENAETVTSYPSNQVKFGVDGTNLPLSFPDTMFDVIEFNFPHWKGKTNAKRNRELVNGFLKSASSVLKSSGEIRIALCHGQGGMPADSLEEWRQGWMPATYAAEHGLLLTHLEPFEPSYGLSSYRGVDRPFFIGDQPQKYYFRFPNGDAVPEDIQISCRHELRVMLHPDKMEASPMAYDDIVHGDAVFQLGQEFIPDGIRFEIPARHLLSPYKANCNHVQLAVFLLNYTGESNPLTRTAADEIRDKIEKEISKRWGLDIAKGGRLVSRPYPYHLLPKLIKGYD